MSDTNEECYLGDGLYASFDGFQIKLRAPRLSDQYGGQEDHEVFLEPTVCKALINYIREIGMARVLE